MSTPPLFGPGADVPDPDRPAEDVTPEVELRERLGMIAGLVATGRAATRTARSTRCPKCRARVLHGYDADRCAELAVVDPTPLDAGQRAACVLADRKLYTLREAGGRAVLDYRDEWADPRLEHPLGRPTLPAHVCGGRFPATAGPTRRTPGTSERMS